LYSSSRHEILLVPCLFFSSDNCKACQWFTAPLCGFVAAILNGKPPPCDEMAGYMSIYLALLAIRSLDHKQTIPAPIEMVTPAFI
jgi:hypothetical protein